MSALAKIHVIYMS